VLEAEDFQVVWQGEDGTGLVDVLDGSSPELILLGWDGPGVSTSLIKDLVASGTEAAIVIITPPDTHHDLSGALEAGAAGCLSCDSNAPDFIAALKMLAHGDVVVSHDMVPAVTGVGDRERSENWLTPRELEVLRALGRGATNQEIAEELHLSPHTVKIHVHQVLVRMGFRNRQQAAAYAARAGLL
jgi:DNA-binding NarL/FixJ family response regulator